MLNDIYAPYHPFESWLYDTAVAPAVTEGVDWDLGLPGQFTRSIPDRGRILDVGCGGGHLAVILANRNPGWRIVGLDLSRQQVRRALKRSRGSSGRTHFVAGSALALPFKTGTFDGLVSVCCIKHWPEPVKGLEECLRVLRPGGSLAVIEVDRDHCLDHARAFVARQRVPFLLKPVAMAGFRWKVAARSLTVTEGVSLFNTVPAAGIQSCAIPGMPLWMILARKETDSGISDGVIR